MVSSGDSDDAPRNAGGRDRNTVLFRVYDSPRVIRFDRSRLLAAPEAVRGPREEILRLLEAGIAAVDPYRCTREALSGEPACVIAFGKAAIAMVRGALDAIEVKGGIAIAPMDAELPITVRVGGHPRPSVNAPAHARELIAIARASRARIVALVSGGGSALLELPRDGIDIETIANISDALMRAGADIEELNAVRCELSDVKGGRLAAAIGRAIETFVINDVPGHGPDLVASGPTCPPRITKDARAVLAKYGVEAPPLARRELPTVVSSRVTTIADGHRARAAMAGPSMTDLPGIFSGEARDLAMPFERGAFVWGGETVVTVRGNGRGGRNHEVALSVLAQGKLRGVFACVGTDGIDGSSDAAGALVDAHAIEEARRAGLDPQRALDTNDSHAFFERLGTQLRCGPTGTNVADVCAYLPTP
jgi:glycerate 2-kinase